MFWKSVVVRWSSHCAVIRTGRGNLLLFMYYWVYCRHTYYTNCTLIKQQKIIQHFQCLQFCLNTSLLQKEIIAALNMYSVIIWLALTKFGLEGVYSEQMCSYEYVVLLSFISSSSSYSLPQKECQECHQ